MYRTLMSLVPVRLMHINNTLFDKEITFKMPSAHPVVVFGVFCTFLISIFLLFPSKNK